MKTDVNRKQRWERPDGWDGTWEDIFEDMGWDPAEVDSVGWSVPRSGPTKESRRAGYLMEFEFDMPQEVEVTWEGSDLIVRAYITTGYTVDLAKVVTLEDAHLDIQPGPQVTKSIS